MAEEKRRKGYIVVSSLTGDVMREDEFFTGDRKERVFRQLPAAIKYADKAYKYFRMPTRVDDLDGNTVYEKKK